MHRLLGVMVAVLWGSGIAGAAFRVHPPPSDPSSGLLFHASFDQDRRADFAVGAHLPYLATYATAARGAEGGQRVPGVFGAALCGTERGGMGDYDALGNFNPERGTIAFFVRETNQPYGFEPLWVTSVDPYYWTMYARLCNKGNALSAWFANEVYRPIILHAPENVRLKEGQWHHIAVVWDQAYGARFYLDGQEVASNWGQASWFSRGMDPNAIVLTHADNISYDELYVFDRPLTPEQIERLRTTNQPPAASEMPPLDFGQAWVRNRRRELSWEGNDPNRPVLRLDKPNTLRQVVPLQARCVKKEGNFVFDGKPGTGWPPLYNYEFNQGNGLHVELPEPYDRMQIEGWFTGRLYNRHTLTEEGRKPWLTLRARTYTTWHRWAKPQPAGWLSFFKAAMEEKGDLPDKELVTDSRICEVSFFRTGAHRLQGSRPIPYYPGPAEANTGKALLGAEFVGRFGPGDRATLPLSPSPLRTPSAQVLAPLRYHHLLVPPRENETALRGLRLCWYLRGDLNGCRFLVSLRDPTLPGRRLLNVDFLLQGSRERDRAQCLDLRLDTADRVIPAGKPLWITFCFEREVQMLLGLGDEGSRVELLTGSEAEVLPEYLQNELSFVHSRFREMSEPRPWGAHTAPETEMLPFSREARELFLPLTELWRRRGDDPKVRALWIWTHKSYEDTSPVEPLPVPGAENAPRWALLQRELFKRCLAVLHWWIENRQTPNGEFGDAWGDDTDLCQNFAKLALLCDPGGRLRAAVRKVADGVYEAGRLERGINRLTMDTLHAYEEGVNVQPVAALMEYGDPILLERLMETAKTVEEYLTAVNPHGRRRFRSWMFGANEVRDQGDYGTDSPGNALFCHPALFLSFYGRHPRALRFLQEWVDGWLALYQRDLASGEKEWTARTRFDDTQVVARDYKVRGYGYIDLFPALYRLTGEPRYRDAWHLWEKPAFPMRGVSGILPALEIADLEKTRDSQIAWAREANLKCPGDDEMGHQARQRLREWELTGDEKPVYEALEACVRKLRLTFEAHTWAEPINDRIWLPDHPLIVMAQGEMSHERNQTFPRHYVSYEGMSDFAAWVREKSDEHLLLWIYSFAPQAEQGTLRVWRTPFGRYRVTVGPDADGNGQPDAVSASFEKMLHRFAGIPIDLPPRQLYAVRIDLVERSPEDFFDRADLAIAPQDVVRTSSGALQVTVHNVGNRPATNIEVALLDKEGHLVQAHTVPHLEAPLDLVPRRIPVQFEQVPAGVVQVALDPTNQIAEINEENNVVKIPMR